MKYLETGSFEPEFNLAFEEYVLEHRRGGEYLMLWQNVPTVVIGLNQNAMAEVNLEAAAALGVRVVRRATGGGAVYHDLDNLNYSIIAGAEDAASLSLRRFMEPVRDALRALGVPAEINGRNDLTAGGLKISGTAQRISGGRVLHHGTLLFRADLDAMSALLRPDEGKFSCKAAKSVRSRVGQISSWLPDYSGAQFKAAMLDYLGGALITRDSLSEAELGEVRRIAREKYASSDWTLGRTADFGFTNSRRFPAGKMEIALKVGRGLIVDAGISGDFLAVLPPEELISALIGCRYTKRDVEEAVKDLPLEGILGGISREELLSLIFD